MADTHSAFCFNECVFRLTGRSAKLTEDSVDLELGWTLLESSIWTCTWQACVKNFLRSVEQTPSQSGKCVRLVLTRLTPASCGSD